MLECSFIIYYLLKTVLYISLFKSDHLPYTEIYTLEVIAEIFQDQVLV